MRSWYLRETSRRLLQDGRGVHRPPRPPRYLSVPRFPSPARVDPGPGDRIPPVGLPSPLLEHLLPGASPPVPCTSRSPSTPLSSTSPTGLPRSPALRRRNPAHLYTSPGPLPVPGRLLPGCSPSTPRGTRDGTRRCTPRRRTPRTSPTSRPTSIRERSWENFSRTSRGSPRIPREPVRSPPGTALQIDLADGSSFFPTPGPQIPPSPYPCRAPGGLLAHLERHQALHSPPAKGSRGLRRSRSTSGPQLQHSPAVPPGALGEDLDRRLDDLGERATRRTRWPRGASG
jgi:hypothetical protein